MWLLDEKVRRELMRLRARAVVTPEALDRQRRRDAGPNSDECYILTRVGSEAVIKISGVLLNSVPWWMEGERCTSYLQIQRALAIANDALEVKKIIFDLNSPGGNVMGLFETLAAIQAVSKPIVTRTPYACSAAYGIAAVGGRIEATTPASMIGSVGVAADFVFWDDMEEISLTSTGTEEKRPDVHTEEGKAVVIRELDAIYKLFVEAISEGRTRQTGKKVSEKEVRDNYGRGATLLAVDARKRGMIDTVIGKSMVRSVSRPKVDDEQPEQDDEVEVPPGAERADEGGEGGAPAPAAAAPIVVAAAAPAPAPPAPSTQPTPAQPAPAPPAAAAPATTEQSPAAASGKNTAAGGKDRKMDPNKLKAEHPEVYAAIFEAGKAEGVTLGEKSGSEKERKRVNAHLKLAKTVGAHDLATKYIESGASVLDEDVHAEYMSAGLNKAAQTARQTDSDNASTVVDGAPAAGAANAGKGQPDMGDKVVAILKNENAA